MFFEKKVIASYSFIYSYYSNRFLVMNIKIIELPFIIVKREILASVILRSLFYLTKIFNYNTIWFSFKAELYHTLILMRPWLNWIEQLTTDQ